MSIRSPRTRVLICLVLISAPSLTLAEALPETRSQAVGLSPERLNRADQVLEEAVADGEIAGAVGLIVRHGKVAYHRAFGMADAEAGMPMTTETIFRIASMTKAVTSVAVMMLYEEGEFLLRDPVSRYLPEWKDVVVLAPDSVQTLSGDDTVPANQPIRIRDLLTHTSGLSYQWDTRLGAMYRDAGITHGLVQDEGTLADKIPILTTIPLVHHPGEARTYGLSTDVLGRLVEVVSGVSLEEFFTSRIFKPLGMDDTHFFLPQGKVARLAGVYQPKEGGGIERTPDGPIANEENALVYSVDYPYRGPRSYFSGGGGLCSTSSDYARFCQMLLNDGELDGTRLLSPKSVDLMRVDHIDDHMPEGAGFGLGFWINEDLGEGGEIGSVGAYGWGGFFNTRFVIDPVEQMCVIFMSQKYPAQTSVAERFRVMAYQAIID